MLKTFKTPASSLLALLLDRWMANQITVVATICKFEVQFQVLGNVNIRWAFKNNLDISDMLECSQTFTKNSHGDLKI